MERVVVFVVLVTWLATSPAFAAGPDSPSTDAPLAAAPVAIKHDFSAKAAGIDQKVRAAVRPELWLAASPKAVQTTQGNQEKSIWQTPWPYLIAGGAAVALVLISRNKDGGLY
jgi:hypothetical protein